MALELVDVEYQDLKGRILDFPVGNTGNTIIARYTFENEFRVDISNSVQIYKLNNKFTISGTLPDGQPATWANLGIVSGTDILVELFSDAGDIPTTVESVQFINGVDLYLVSDPDASINNVSFSSGLFKQFDTPHGLELAFNVAANDSPGKYSLIDGEAQIFTIDDFNFLGNGNTAQMIQLGNRSGASDITANATLVQDGIGDKTIFIIEVTFRYPHYLQPELFTIDSSVAPYIEIKALQQFANPNVATKYKYVPLGNVGFRDEHFNGGASAYEFVSISWTNAANEPVSDMDYAELSNFEIEITGDFDSGCQFNIGWFWSPVNESDYKNLPLSLDHNLMLVTKTTGNSTIFGPENIVGYVNSDGAQLTISNLSYTVIGSGPGATLKVTGQTAPNSEFTEWFEAREGDRAYAFWIDCDGSAFNSDWNSSTSVNVTAGEGQMVKTEVPLGSWEDISYFKILDHNDDEFVTPTVYTEDDLNAQIKFRLPKYSTWESISGSIVVFNGTTGENFTLESHSFNIEPSVQLPILPDGTQPINMTITRNFKLPNGSGKNEVSLVRDVTTDNVGNYGLKLNYGFLCRWEYWLQQLNVHPSFFTTQTKNWEQFQTGGWGLKFQLSITKTEGSYQNGMPFYIKTYDDYIGASVTEFFKLDATQINAPLADQPTRIKITHTINPPYDWDSPSWANMTVEPYESGPRWLLSSIPYPLDMNNPLYPLPGEVGVKITLVGDQAITECLFDPFKMNGLSDLSFTGRIQSEETPPVGGRFIFQNGNGVLNQEDNNLIPQ